MIKMSERICITVYNPEMEEGEFWFDVLPDDPFNEEFEYSSDLVEYYESIGYIVMFEFLGEMEEETIAITKHWESFLGM
jgi:hypothetical protein